MIELPEAFVLANQINATLSGKRIAGVIAGHPPHRLVWYYGDRARYSKLLVGRALGSAHAFGSLVEIEAEAAAVLLGEGTATRFHGPDEPRPARHQLLVEFVDRSALSVAVQMYGGMGVCPAGELDNPYSRVAKARPSPFSLAFDAAYFARIVSDDAAQKLSLKGVLATGQRIPGLGNGVLQDILFNAGWHPRKKVGGMSAKDRTRLFKCITTTLAAMADRGGRNTEFDLFGSRGGYATILSRDAVNKPCPTCGAPIRKESYLSGSIYSCPRCQSV